MFKFTLTIYGVNGEKPFYGSGRYILGAFDNLIDNINKLTKVSPKERVAMLEVALTAAGNMGCIVENCQPETEFSILYEKS